MISLNLEENVLVIQSLESIIPQIEQAADILISTLCSGGMVAFCGNGGSAADCQHLAGELVGRFQHERPAWRALALTADTSVLTAIGNDYGFECVFARQVEALLGSKDTLMILSTSGSSPNCLLAATAARTQGSRVIALTGSSGGGLKALSDICICVPSCCTPRIQEAHMVIGHILCSLIESRIAR